MYTDEDLNSAVDKGIFKGINASFGFVVFTILSWGLSEFFVRKRKMALPATTLLLAFIGGVFALSLSFLPPSDTSLYKTD